MWQGELWGRVYEYSGLPFSLRLDFLYGNLTNEHLIAMGICKTALLALLAVLPASFAVSNDFESGWDQTAWPIYAPDCNQGGTVTLDSTTAHSGKNSIKVTSPGGYCGHIFFGTTDVPKSGDVYVRVWL